MQRTPLNGDRLAEWTRSDEVLAMTEANIAPYLITRKFNIRPSEIARLVEHGRRRRLLRARTGAAFAAPDGSDKPNDDHGLLNMVLPCSVTLNPNTTVQQGCTLGTLIDALRARA